MCWGPAVGTCDQSQEAPVLDVSERALSLISMPPSDPGGPFYAGCCDSCPLTQRSNVLKTIRIRSSLGWYLPNTERHLGQSSDTPSVLHPSMLTGGQVQVTRDLPCLSCTSHPQAHKGSPLSLQTCAQR